MQITTNVGQVRVTVTPSPNGEWHWHTDQRSNGWPVGQDWSNTSWGALAMGTWHAIDVHRAATNLQRCIDDRVPHKDLMLAIDHYGDTTVDSRIEDFLADHESVE